MAAAMLLGVGDWRALSPGGALVLMHSLIMAQLLIGWLWQMGMLFAPHSSFLLSWVFYIELTTRGAAAISLLQSLKLSCSLTTVVLININNNCYY